MSRRGRVERVALGICGIGCIALELISIFTSQHVLASVGYLSIGLFALAEATGWSIRKAKRD